MPRRPRVVIAGVPHHVTQRGNNRACVFFAPEDYRRYLELLCRHALRHGTRILGYCLMSNHVHLIAVPQSENSLARTLGRAHSEYALSLNHVEGRSGHVWQGRFFSCATSATQLLSALRYVEFNPVRAKLAGAAWDWPWSSARAHVVDGVRDAALDPHWMEYVDHWDFTEWREMLSAYMPEAESEAVRRATRTGEPLGSREFISELESQMGKRLRVWERGRPKRKPQSQDKAAIQGRLFVADGK
jgi:putative transposase